MIFTACKKSDSSNQNNNGNNNNVDSLFYYNSGNHNQVIIYDNGKTYTIDDIGINKDSNSQKVICILETGTSSYYGSELGFNVIGSKFSINMDIMAYHGPANGIGTYKVDHVSNNRSYKEMANGGRNYHVDSATFEVTDYTASQNDCKGSFTLWLQDSLSNRKTVTGIFNCTH